VAERALTAVNQEACIQDISTRSVDDLVKAMSITGISKRQVSRLCEEIDQQVRRSTSRSISKRSATFTTTSQVTPTNTLGIAMARSSALIKLAAQRS